MIYTHQINVNINPNSIVFETETRKIVQGDVNTNKFIITIKDGNNDYQIPTGVNARLMARKTDGNQVFIDCEIAENKVEILMPEQLFTAIGNVNCTVGLYNGINEELLISLPFKIEVIENPFKPLNVYSTSVYETLTNAIFSVDGKIQDMEDEINSAVTVTSETVTKAVEATDIAIENANIATKKADDAAKLENIKEKAEAAVEATDKANNATQRANTAAFTCEGIVEDVKEATQEILDEKNITFDGYKYMNQNDKLATYDYCAADRIMIKILTGNVLATPQTAGIDISPDNKQSFTCVGNSGNFNLITCKKNLFPFVLGSYSSISQGATVGASSDNSITVSSHATGGQYASVNYMGFPIAANKTYTVSFTATGNNLTNTKICISKNSSFDTSDVICTVSANSSATFSTDGTYNNISLMIYPSYGIAADNTATFSNIQIELGTYKTTREAYKSNTYNVALKDTSNNTLEPLRAIPNQKCDKIIKQSGIWGVQRSCGQIKLTGTEYWQTSALQNTSETFYAASTIIDNLIDWEDGKLVTNDLYCTHFKNDLVWDANKEAVINQRHSGGIRLRIRINNSRLHTLDINAFKTWLSEQNTAGTPVTIIYPLKTLTFTPLSNEMQILLDYSILSFEGKTNVFVNDGANINLCFPKGAFPLYNKFTEIYPLGSVYHSVSNTNPSSYFGGTWVKLDNQYSTLESKTIYIWMKTA